MHQTFYIDIDEEITSVVERLRHARASEIILVVPKRALLIQSIVNLRILKREADEARLQLMMVTQDKLGKILIEKAGIFVQQKMENISDEEISVSEDTQPVEEYKAAEAEIGNGKDRLNAIGSSSYFDENLAKENVKAEQDKLKIEKVSLDKQELEKEKLINKELVLAEEKKPEKGLSIRPSFDLKPAVPVLSRGSFVKPEAPVVKSSFNQEQKNKATPKTELVSPATSSKAGLASGTGLTANFQDTRIEDFFYQPNAIARQSKRQEKKVAEKSSENYNLSGKVHRWFWVFGVVAFILVLGIAFYVFVPKADMVVSVKLDSNAIDSQVVGKVAISSVDIENGIIPAKEVSSIQEISESYDASGSELVSNQKSHGRITIYNEYSTSEQPLVATTRFLTNDGKLFRLVKGVTVPGTSTVNGQTKSGEIEAEVVADSSGEEYNIEPSTFNIPGFKSSGIKYEKIYAKSNAAMTGGGKGTDESKVITDSDIAAAKSKILSVLNNKLEDDMKKSGGEDAIILDGGMNESDVSYNFSNSSGDVMNSFQVSASAEAKAIVVNQEDLNKVIVSMLEKSVNGKSIDPDSLKIDFSRSDADFTNGTINIKFHAMGKITPDFTADTIKKAVLGKNEEQVKNYLSELPNIEKIEVTYWPPFINGRVPLLPNRVEVTLDRT